MADDSFSRIRYGRRKLTEEAYLAQAGKKRRTLGGRVYGSRKGDGGAPAVPEPAKAARPETAPPAPPSSTDSSKDPLDFSTATVAEMEAALTADPSLLDVALGAEFGRERPRVSALNVLRRFEDARPGGPRAQLLTFFDRVKE